MATAITCDRCGEEILDGDPRWTVAAGRYEQPAPVVEGQTVVAPALASSLPPGGPATTGLFPAEGVTLDLHPSCWEAMIA